jgi:uncharacterized membrane protein
VSAASIALDFTVAPTDNRRVTGPHGQDHGLAWLPIAVTVAASLWVLAIFAAPAVIAQSTSAAAFVFEIGARICHQRPERSFHIAGMQMPVCARCLGLYLSGALGALSAWFGAPPRRGPLLENRMRLMLIVAAAPTAVSVAFEWLGFAYPSNVVRALLALPLGAFGGWAFLRSLRMISSDR